jgi:MFS family permease
MPVFLYGTGRGMILPVVPLYAQDMGAGLAFIGIIVAMQGIGTMLTDLPGGLLVSKLGAKRTMVVGLSATATIAVAIGFTADVNTLIALMLLNGMAMSLWFLALMTYLAVEVPNTYRGRAISRAGGVLRIGTFVGPIVGGLMGKYLGMETVFFGQAVVSLAALGFVIQYARHGHGATQGTQDGAHTRVINTVVEHKRSFLTAGTAALSLVLLRFGRQVLFPLWGDSIGLDVAQIGFIFGIASAVDMSLFYPTGIIMDRWGRKWTMVPSLTVLSLSLALVSVTNSFEALLAVGILSGFGNGLGSGAVMTLGADLAPPETVGEFLGVWRFITDVGAVAGPVVVGLSAELLTLSAAAVATGGLGAVGAVVMLVFVKETLLKRNIELTSKEAELAEK